VPSPHTENFAVSALAFDELILWTFVLAVTLLLLGVYIADIRQKEHAILKNYPIVGHFRYFLEYLGVFLRQYFYASDRDELPFNRAERGWVYRAAKNINNMVGFGSTRDLHPVGTILFINAPFPPLGHDKVAADELTIGPYCHTPYTTHSFFNISAMSYGAISKPAILALSHGARMAGCWLNTGEGGVAPYHLEGGADLIVQIGTAKYGVRTPDGMLDDQRLRELAALPQVRMFEVKLSQGAKPGKGGILPGIKVTPEIAAIRGIAPYQDSISPNRHPDIANITDLLNVIEHIRAVTGKPVGCKFVLGSYEWLDDFFSEIHQRGIEQAPDFLTLDSADGGTGAAPMSLVDYVGLTIEESLPVLIDKLLLYGLRERIKVIAAGKLVTPAEVAWALCIGADFINTARGFMFALGCIQALRCHTDRCPTGITTHDPRLLKGLDPASKAIRVYNYAKNMVHEVGVIAQSCGVDDPRQLSRHHARMVTEDGLSIPLSDIYPIPKTSKTLPV
jgi:glutamate synthase domain-containing protein 2